MALAPKFASTFIPAAVALAPRSMSTSIPGSCINVRTPTRALPPPLYCTHPHRRMDPHVERDTQDTTPSSPGPGAMSSVDEIETAAAAKTTTRAIFASCPRTASSARPAARVTYLGTMSATCSRCTVSRASGCRPRGAGDGRGAVTPWPDTHRRLAVCIGGHKLRACTS
jgi:hypothetical protein